MIPTDKPLFRLTAGELMSPATARVPAGMSLRGAARLLAQAGVSGAPVVDADGRCVGVISATDFLRWAGKGKEADRPWPAVEDAVCGWEVVAADGLPAGTVGRHMTADPVTVNVTVPLGELARMMLDAHIHRVIVVDRDRRPVGVVSSTDILAAVARADAVRRLAAGRPGPAVVSR
jgi:CBS domain-containing protein